MQAVPVTWTLDGVILSDGGTASGSFVYDADTDTYSGTNIVSTSGSSLMGNSYAFVNPGNADATKLGLVSSSGPDFIGDQTIFLIFSSTLTNLGGTTGISTLLEATCGNSNCEALGAPIRTLASGSIIGALAAKPTSVPTLSFYALIITILGLFSIAVRKLPNPARP